MIPPESPPIIRGQSCLSRPKSVLYTDILRPDASTVTRSHTAFADGTRLLYEVRFLYLTYSVHVLRDSLQAVPLGQRMPVLYPKPSIWCHHWINSVYHI